MGAPAVRAPAKTRRTQAKPRPASKRRSVQGAATARKPRATAQRGATRKPRAAATRTAPRRTRASRGPVVSGGVVALPVAAVGRTAHAVSGLADSGLVHGLARSRAWIVLLGLLLAGIVAVNVTGLSLNAANSRVAAKIGELEQKNSVLRGRIAARTSTEQIQKAAAGLGLGIPEPDAIHYLHGDSKDAEIAAKRLAAGEIGATLPADESVEVVDPAATIATPTVDPVTGATVDPATGAIVDPATGAPVDPATGLPIDPATGLPVSTDATATAVP
jgi:hypothetical protein